MTNYAMEEIIKLRKEQIDTDLMHIIRAKASSAVKTELTSAKFWMDYLVGQVQTEQPLTPIENTVHFIGKLNVKQLQRMAKKYLSRDRYFQIITLPSNWPRSSTGH
jgi:hypothetical protein